VTDDSGNPLAGHSVETIIGKPCVRLKPASLALDQAERPASMAWRSAFQKAADSPWQARVSDHGPKIGRHRGHVAGGPQKQVTEINVVSGMVDQIGEEAMLATFGYDRQGRAHLAYLQPRHSPQRRFMPLPVKGWWTKPASQD
jgi:hypothetical protein